VFLRECRDPGFTAQLILPTSNFRGRHVVAATSSVVFDWRGFSPRDAFLAEYSEAYRSKYPEWDYSLVPVTDPVGEHFCARHNHRRPDHFLHDAIPRAKVYVQQLPPVSGRVATKFVIQIDGSVGFVGDAGGTTMPDDVVIECVMENFRTLVFPQPQGGEVIVTYPLTFSPDEPDKTAPSNQLATSTQPDDGD
jgi:hypothetical protein